jgi:plastocyanin
MTRGPLVVCLVAALAAAADAATVSGVVTRRGTPLPGAVVYLERLDGPLAGPPPGRVVMDQKNLSFVPRVLPVTVGTTVEFTNSDDIQHNVFSPSRAAGAFDLGSYSRGEARSVVMREPGDVLVLCNIHMEMEAHILVLRDPFFALAGGDGHYRIGDVPPGRYAVKVWQRTWLPLEQTATVSGVEPLSLDVGVER